MRDLKPREFVFLLAIAILVCVIIKRCNVSPKILKSSHTESFHSDTIWPDTVKTILSVKVPGPVRTYTVSVHDTIIISNIYKDSLTDSKVSIYYEDSVQGKLLGKKMSYKLHVPLLVTNTHIITDSVVIESPVPQNGFYGISEAGKNNISIGADWISKKRYSIGYRYNILDKSSNIKVGYKIF